MLAVMGTYYRSIISHFHSLSMYNNTKTLIVTRYLFLSVAIGYTLLNEVTHTTQNEPAGIVTESNSPSLTGRVYRWIAQPNSRSTAAILENCLFTIFICTYSVICLNFPSKDESIIRIVRLELFWTILAIAIPEFVLTYATGQWETARE